MVIKEKINLPQSIITDILCDCCGKSCKVLEGNIQNELREDDGHPFYVFEYLKLEAYWGYHSKKDGDHWEAHLCESCVDEKLSFINFDKNKTKVLNLHKK